MKVFYLPDLGEGLPEATIVKWHVKEGDFVKADDLLVTFETDKSAVDIPSPYTGKIIKIYGKAGEILKVGSKVVDFDIEDESSIDNKAEAISKNDHDSASNSSESASIVGSVQHHSNFNYFINDAADSKSVNMEFQANNSTKAALSLGAANLAKRLKINQEEIINYFSQNPVSDHTLLQESDIIAYAISKMQNFLQVLSDFLNK